MTDRVPHNASNAGLVFSKGFDDLEDLLVSTRQWDLDFLQLQRGRFFGRITQVIASSWQLSHARFDSALRQEGLPPTGLRNIVIPATSCQDFTWRRHRISGNSIMLFPLGSELESVTGPGFEVYILAVPEAHLDQLCIGLGLPGIQALTATAEVVQCDPAEVQELRQTLHGYVHHLVSTPQLIHEPSFSSVVEFDLCARVLLALARGLAVKPEDTPRRQLYVLKATETFIKAHAHKAPTIHQICQQLCISERTVRSAFHHRYGVSPKAFLMAYRLKHARRQLRNHHLGSTTVQEVASAWGFWHMGQFAHDYKAMFGELPSQTLTSPST